LTLLKNPVYWRDYEQTNGKTDNRVDKDVSDAVVRDAVRLAERWEKELKGAVTTPDPYAGCGT